ncbi:MAG: hypothetical protein NTV29_13735 [Planctomycetota bacterium]|nr:hypothetical protein [Planctomycetota bacterium]
MHSHQSRRLLREFGRQDKRWPTIFYHTTIRSWCHNFVAHYLFDKDGAFLDAKIHDLGSRESGVLPGNALMDDDRVATLQKELLEELVDTKFCNIKVSPFVQESNGVNFGLIIQAPEEEDEE